MLTLVLATLMAGAGLVMAGLAAWVAWRRYARMGWSLALVLVAVAVWGLAYAVELSVDDIPDKERWGIVKYVGILLLSPAWLTFVLQYTGREHLVTRRLQGLMAILPVVTMTLLVVPATHDLVRYYSETTEPGELPIVETGPVFWVVLVYSNLVLVGATLLFVASMVRLARTYRRTATVLLASAVLPWAANLLHNLEVGWFTRMDLTPFAFIFSGGLLVWSLFHERLADLTPLARGAVLDSMADGVFVLDAFGRLVDVNPAAAALVGGSRSALVGRLLSDVLPEAADGPGASDELLLVDVPPGSGDRVFDVSRRPLTDDEGRTAGQLVVLGEVTQRVRDRERLQRVLSEKSRIAASLQASMVPPRLPEVAGVQLASRYEPAGDGSEVGGDFLDVFELEGSRPEAPAWGIVLGDVSGKGAEAAAVSAAARYTLRAVARVDRSPADTLATVNRKLIAQSLERHCTLVHGHLRPTGSGTAVTLTLAGHHPPLVLRHDGSVEEVGTPGTALALLDAAELHDAELELAPGELLCAFTDGIVESRRAAEMFGTERLARLLVEHGHLPLDELGARISAEVRAFHGHDLADDLALLLVRSS